MTGTLYEFCEAFHISLSKARKMDKAGWLRLSESSRASDPIRATIANGDRLTAAQLVELIESPGLLLELGKYTGTAEAAVRALGDAKGQAAPKLVVAHIMEAAKGEAEAMQILIGWLKEVIPTSPVNHAFIAVRLLLGIPESLRKSEGARIPRAMLNARQHPDFAGHWKTVKQASRIVTFYQKLALDL